MHGVIGRFERAYSLAQIDSINLRIRNCPLFYNFWMFLSKFSTCSEVATKRHYIQPIFKIEYSCLQVPNFSFSLNFSIYTPVNILINFSNRLFNYKYFLLQLFFRRGNDIIESKMFCVLRCKSPKI